MNARVLAITVGIVALAALTVWDQKRPVPPAPAKAAAQAQPAAQAPADVQRNPERNAYFGETHLHKSWSVDAWVMGNRLTGPGDALKYAQGQTIRLVHDQSERGGWGAGQGRVP